MSETNDDLAQQGARESKHTKPAHGCTTCRFAYWSLRVDNKGVCTLSATDLEIAADRSTGAHISRTEPYLDCPAWRLLWGTSTQ